MPAPVQKVVTEPLTGTPSLVQKPVGDLTHKVTLLNGKTVTMLDSRRPGSPWIFKEGETVKVPADIAKRLQSHAVDAVTVKVGTKVTGKKEQKFRIELVGAADAPAGEGEEEVGADGAHLREG